jgi:hypothetical protein
MSDQVSVEVLAGSNRTSVEIIEQQGTRIVEVTAPEVVPAVEVLVPGPQGGKGEPGPPKAITIAQPRFGDEFTLFYTQFPTTITQVLGVVRGINPSATMELRYDSNRAAAGTLATVPAAITSVTTGQAVTIQNMPIPADRYVWIKVTSVEGTVIELNVSVEL